jgi:hypothetical protein
MGRTQVYERVLEILSTEDQWTKHHYAETIKGQTMTQVEPSSKDANCFCMIGAVHRAVSGFDRRPLPEQEAELRDAMAGLTQTVCATTRFPSIAHFNDHETTSYADVISMIRTAIERNNSRIFP